MGLVPPFDGALRTEQDPVERKREGDGSHGGPSPVDAATVAFIPGRGGAGAGRLTRQAPANRSSLPSCTASRPFSFETAVTAA